MKFYKYCRKCGTKIKIEKSFSRFSNKTGLPIQRRYTASCPNYGYGDEGGNNIWSHYLKIKYEKVNQR